MTEVEGLEQEFADLVLEGFDEGAAWRLGCRAVEEGRARALPLVVDIRTRDRILFHAALPGSAPLNDRWVARKSAVALMFGEPSFLVGARNREKGRTVADQGLPTDRFADHGGAVPIRVRGVGVVACLTISGLPQAEDHQLAMALLKAFRNTETN
jgi:uncharacterized protein (UPF0303 family)